jgi:hypothetical protein
MLPALSGVWHDTQKYLMDPTEQEISSATCAIGGHGSYVLSPKSLLCCPLSWHAVLCCPGPAMLCCDDYGILFNM